MRLVLILAAVLAASPVAFAQEVDRPAAPPPLSPAAAKFDSEAQCYNEIALRRAETAEIMKRLGASLQDYAALVTRVEKADADLVAAQNDLMAARKELARLAKAAAPGAPPPVDPAETPPKAPAAPPPKAPAAKP